MEKHEINEKVTAALEQIRPFLQADGGDIRLVEITDDLIVKVELRGACGCCPYSIQTLKSGVEKAIKEEVPQIKSIVAVNI
ncbi:MAG: NifU family protein [Bacteroidia bacterium]|nr:NifU family protein [Bacteroidia bacterium]